MAQGQQSTIDAPDTLPPDFFDKKKLAASGPQPAKPPAAQAAPDTLPGDFFDKKDEPSAVSRFNESLSTGLGSEPGFVDTLKAAGSGLKHMATHPIDSASLLLHGAADAQQQVIDKAYEEQHSPDFWTKVRGVVRGAESAIPVAGPLLSKAGDEFRSGNFAGGVGTTAALAAPAAMEPAAGAARAGITKVNAARTALAEKTVGPLVYENVGETGADVRMGVNPERGLTKEGLGGPFTGKQGLIEDAEARTAELKTSANSILKNHANSGNLIDAGPLIDQAIDKAIKNTEKVAGSTERLEGLRTALKTKYGPTEGHPLEINQLKSEIQEAAANVGAYKNTQPVEASVAAAMGDAANRIKEAVNKEVPEAADLNQRMADLIDARRGLERKVNAERGQSIFGDFHQGMVGRMLNRTVGSAPARTTLARALMTGLTEDVPPPVKATPFTPVPQYNRPAGPAFQAPEPPIQKPVGVLPTVGFPAQPDLWAGGGERAPRPGWETPQRIQTSPGSYGAEAAAEARRRSMGVQGSLAPRSSFGPPFEPKANRPTPPAEPRPAVAKPFSKAAKAAEPAYAYRVRSQGEEGVPISESSHAHATTALEDAQRLVPGRKMTMKDEPQEIVKIDLSKLKEGKDYTRLPREGQPDWIKLHRPLKEDEVQIVKPQ